MAEDRRKEIVRHLSEDDLDRLLAETDDDGSIESAEGSGIHGLRVSSRL